EFNARFGDPEAQVLLPLLAEPAIELLMASAHEALDEGRVRTRENASAGVVAAASGYPGTPRTGDVITGLDAIAPDALVFQAGTRRASDGTLRTSGGRVLSVVATAGRLDAAIANAYENLGGVHFEDMQYRRDIGRTSSPLLTPAGS
ncbi:MAG: phosphoribosylamine--glycine ligase, partial [Candidatus Dormibacteraeota bacterium]|nr:phosphoribosylamine--glycine ligase [Candidatus Dormibacteraeota bacterium]